MMAAAAKKDQGRDTPGHRADTDLVLSAMLHDHDPDP